MIFILMATACLRTTEGSHVAAMAEWGQEHCGDKDHTPGSCRIWGEWTAYGSGYVGIFTLDAPTPEGALDLYLISRKGRGEFVDSNSSQQLIWPPPADTAMVELAKLLQKKRCYERRAVGGSYGFGGIRSEGDLLPSPCIPIFGKDGTIEVVVLPESEQD